MAPGTCGCTGATFARTDPAECAYGLDVDAAAIANIIGLYVAGKEISVMPT